MRAKLKINGVGFLTFSFQSAISSCTHLILFIRIVEICSEKDILEIQNINSAPGKFGIQIVFYLFRRL